MLTKQIRLFLLIMVACVPQVCTAEVLSLDDALRATYIACVGIDDNLADLKKMAGINTAVTGVGTGLGAGATAVGIVKANKDAQAKSIADRVDYTKKFYNVVDESALQEMDKQFKALLANEKSEFETLRKQSKTLGHWRTGLIAGNTATNVVGAIIAGKNKVDADLETQINDCKSAVKKLQDSIVQARINGEDVTEANEIADACREYNYVDISPINKRAKGAMISSIIGATTGVAGTVTSAVANTEAIREDSKGMEKTAESWDKEKKVNTTANVLAGASTVASATATVFNATQISAIKKVANVASKCTGVLK